MFGCTLRETVSTMAEQFSDAGYSTAGFIGAHALSDQYELNRGFETWDAEFENGYDNWIIGQRRPGDEVTDNALNWIENQDTDTLLFMHYFDAHDGAGDFTDEKNEESLKDRLFGLNFLEYLYSDSLRSLDDAAGAPLKKAYRSWQNLTQDQPIGLRYHLQQVQRIDKEIGRLTEKLKKEGTYQETTIILFADHGDSFGEHGEIGHRKYLYDTTMRVPLIIKPAADAVLPREQTCDELVGLVDLFPTVADIEGIDIPAVSGTSLVTDADNLDKRYLYGETRHEQSVDQITSIESDLVSIRNEKWKLIIDETTGNEELYNTQSDPDEKHDVSKENSDIVGQLSSELGTMRSPYPTKDEDIDMNLDKSTAKERLEGLGYL